MFGPYRLDLERCRVLRDGQPVRWWSSRQFELLKMLIEANGEVVSYDTLATTVWAGTDVQPHTINETAHNLSRNLVEYGDCIQNQFGIGFCFRRPPTAPSGPGAVDLDLDSQTLYSVGVEDWNRRTESSLQRAVANSRLLLARRPDFVPALVMLADCLSLLAHAGFPVLRPTEVLPEVRSVVAKALKLARGPEAKSEAYAALGKLQLLFEWQWRSAESNFKKALRLNPRNGAAYHGLAHVFLITYRWKRALRAISQARHIDTRSPMIHGTEGWLLYFMGRTEEAVVKCRQTATLHPEFPAGYVMLALACEAEGLKREASAAFRRSHELQPSPVPLAGLGHLYGLSGQTVAAQRTLKGLALLAEQRVVVSPYFYALVYVGLQDNSRALHCLEQAHDDHFDWLMHLAVDPRWRCLYGFRRFKELLKRMGLYEFWQNAQ